VTSPTRDAAATIANRFTTAATHLANAATAEGSLRDNAKAGMTAALNALRTDELTTPTTPGEHP
jgi:hypothetical protein